MSISGIPKYIVIIMTDNIEKVTAQSDDSSDTVDKCIDVTMETVTATSTDTPPGRSSSRLRSNRTPPSKCKELFRSPASSTRSNNNRKRTASSPAKNITASSKKKAVSGSGSKGKSNNNTVNLKPPPEDISYEIDKKK